MKSLPGILLGGGTPGLAGKVCTVGCLKKAIEWLWDISPDGPDGPDDGDPIFDPTPDPGINAPQPVQPIGPAGPVIDPVPGVIAA